MGPAADSVVARSGGDHRLLPKGLVCDMAFALRQHRDLLLLPIDSHLNHVSRHLSLLMSEREAHDAVLAWFTLDHSLLHALQTSAPRSGPNHAARPLVAF